MKKISCSLTTYCIAVGASSGGGLSYWKATESGGTWTLSSGTPPTPSGGSSPILKDVACSAESACTAVGAYKAESTWKPLVERWNGTSWSVQSAPNPSEGTAEEAMRAGAFLPVFDILRGRRHRRLQALRRDLERHLLVD